MGLRERWFRNAPAGGALARAVAKAYKNLKEQHPAFSHHDLLQAVLEQRESLTARVSPGRAAELNHIGAWLATAPEATLGDLAFRLSMTEAGNTFEALGVENVQLLQRVLDEEIVGVLGYVPSSPTSEEQIPSESEEELQAESEEASQAESEEASQAESEWSAPDLGNVGGAIEYVGDLWSFFMRQGYLLVVPTSEDRQIVGGLAQQAAERIPGLAEQYAQSTSPRVLLGAANVLLMPTRRTAQDVVADKDLIAQGLQSIRQAVENGMIKDTLVFPRLGTGQGNLPWEEVHPDVEKYLRGIPHIIVRPTLDVLKLYEHTLPRVVGEEEPQDETKAPWETESAEIEDVSEETPGAE